MVIEVVIADADGELLAALARGFGFGGGEEKPMFSSVDEMTAPGVDEDAIHGLSVFAQDLAAEHGRGVEPEDLGSKGFAFLDSECR